VAIDKAIRMASLGLLVALCASASNGQETATPATGASQEPVAVSPPPTLAGTPAKAPKVTCKDDQLTISADNSTLGSVLAAVRACVGVQIDIPAGAGGGRTFEELGPGPVREVLASLLSGSGFDYVIGSSSTNPQKVESVLLMQRTADVASSPDRALTPARRAWVQSHQDSMRSTAPGEEEAVEEPSASTGPDEAVTVSAPADNAVQVPANDTPPAAPAAPDAPQAPAGGITTVPASSVQDPASNNNPALNDGKDTQQRITDMQQMFEQRRQMTQQQQNSTTPQP
jgi:hypothetical protein